MAKPEPIFCLPFTFPLPPVDFEDFKRRWLPEYTREMELFNRKLNAIVCPCCYEPPEKPGLPATGIKGPNCDEVLIALDDVLPDGVIDEAFSGKITASGSLVGRYTFAVASGTLPPGLGLSVAGLLSGTPTTAGTYEFTVAATDLYGCKGVRVYSMAVVASEEEETPCEGYADVAVAYAACDVMPTAYRIAGYSEGMLSCDECDDAPEGATVWNGVLPVYFGECNWYMPDPNYSINGKWLVQPTVFLNYNGCVWNLVITCLVNDSMQAIWSGQKTTGLTPDGVYTRIEGLDDTETLTIEAVP